MRNIIILASLFFILLESSSCTYKNAVELYPCDSINVSYQNNVESIIRARCYSCHSNQNAPVFGTGASGTIRLEGRDSLKKWTDFGLVIPNIKHEPGVLAMPKGGPKLSQCEIAKIEKWVNMGAPNN